MKRTPFLLVLTTATLAGCNAQAKGGGPIVAAGHVEATDIHVSAKVAGRIEDETFQEGDSVKVGQVLTRQDTTDLRLALQQATADREQGGADLRLRIAGARKEDVAEMEAQIRSTEADITGAQLDLKRMAGLLERGSGTEKARDDAKTRVGVLEARAAAQKQTLAKLRAGSRPEEIDAARGRVNSLDARIAQFKQQIDDAVVISPVDGVITSRIAEKGELLQPGSPICVITKLAEAWLTVYVTDEDLALVKIGQDVTVTTDGGQTRKGKLTYIASKAEFTPKNVQTKDERVKLVYRVKIGLDNADGFFKPGMPAEARFDGTSSTR